MATFDYNPITGQLDLVGGGASYIDGVVADSSLLPVTLGTPALDAVYLAKAGSGVWLINRKPAGLYCRVANDGDLDDWTYLGAFPEVNSSANWSLYDGTTPSKELKFDLSGISASTVRTLTVPDASGTIARTETFAAPPAIGSTTAAAGSFSTLNVTTAGIFTSPSLNLGGNSGLYDGSSTTLRLAVNGAQLVSFFGGSANNRGIVIRDDVGEFQIGGASIDVRLGRDAANTLSLKNTTNAQNFNLYGTFTSATNYQRLAIKTKAVTLSGLTGASVATTGGFIPDGAVLVGLTTRVSTAITGATGYDIGDGSDADRWGANIGFALNTSSDNTNWTAGTIECFTAAQEVTLTAVGSNFTGGAVVIVAHYLAGEAD